MYYVYVIQSLNTASKFYIGCTADLKRRFKEHNAGDSKTTSLDQWRLIYYEAFLTLSLARKREFRLKTNRNVKKQLMNRILNTSE